METESQAIPISDLFGNARYFQKGKPLDERATLVKFFCEELARQPRFLGVRLGHYTLSDLYALKSQFKDRLRRPCHVCLAVGATGSCIHSRDTAAKYFWYITKTV